MLPKIAKMFAMDYTDPIPYCTATMKMRSQRGGSIGERRTHRLRKCDSEQAGTEEEKTSNGYTEETVRSVFFACHGTPPSARQCWLPPASEARTIEIDDSIVRRYASDIERDRENYTEVCDVCPLRPIILDVQPCPILTSPPLDRGTSTEPISH